MCNQLRETFLLLHVSAILAREEKNTSSRELPDKFSAKMVDGGRESPSWKFNAEWGWVVGNSWRPILAERGRIRGAYMDSR